MLCGFLLHFKVPTSFAIWNLESVRARKLSSDVKFAQ